MIFEILHRFFSHDVILWKKKKKHRKIHLDKERVPYKYPWLLTHFIICYHPSCSVVIRRKRQTWTKIIHSVVSSFLAFFSEEARNQQSHTESRKAISITRGYKKSSWGKMCTFFEKRKREGPSWVCEWHKRHEIWLAESSPYLLTGLLQQKGWSNYKTESLRDIPEQIFGMLGASGYFKHSVMWLPVYQEWVHDWRYFE